MALHFSVFTGLEVGQAESVRIPRLNELTWPASLSLFSNLFLRLGNKLSPRDGLVDFNPIRSFC